MYPPQHDIVPVGDVVIKTITVEEYDQIKIEVLQVFIMDHMIKKLARLLEPDCTDREKNEIGLEFHHYQRDMLEHARRKMEQNNL